MPLSEAQTQGLAEIEQEDVFNTAQESFGYGEPPGGYANIWTSAIAEMANDVDTKIRVYARSRFPNEDIDDSVKRYQISKAGGNKIIFQGDDGKLYEEQGDTLGEVIKRFGAGMIGEAGIIAAETFAASKAIPLRRAVPLFAGVAGLTSVAKYALTGEEIDERDLIRQGLNVGLGAGFQGLSNAVNARSTMLEGLESLAPEDRARITATQQDFENSTGVQLPIDQASGSEYSGLNVLGGFLRSRISSSDRLSKNLQDQVDQVNTQADRYAGGLNMGREVDPSVVSNRAVETAKGYESKLKQNRTAQVEQAYNDSYVDGIDTDAVALSIQNLRDELPNLSGKQKKLYENYINDLLDDAEVPIETPKLGTDGQPLLDAGGDPIVTVTKQLEKVPTTNMQRIHNARKQLDIDFNENGNIPVDIYLKLRGEFNAILKTNPKFADADARFEGLSDMIEAEMNGIFGRLAAKQRGDLVQLVSDFFTPTKSSPFMVDRARRQISREDPQLWADMVRVYFANALNAARKQESKGSGANVLWQLHKRLWKDKTQRKIMQAALTPQQYTQFEKLMENARLVGLAPDIGSPTEPRQALERELRDGASGKVAKAIQLVRVFDWLQSTQSLFSQAFYKNAIKDLTDTFMQTGGIERLNKQIERSSMDQAITGSAIATGGNLVEQTGSTAIDELIQPSLGIPNQDMNSEPTPQPGYGLSR